MKPAAQALTATAILFTIACVVHQSGNGQTQRPNILLIVSDDVGYADIGIYGSRDIPTPNINRIAQEGIRFTDAYVSGPYCSPTRAGLIRSGDWKLVKTRDGPLVDVDPSVLRDLSEAGLYNLAEDIGETRNRAAERPDKVKEPSDLWQQWNGRLSQPL